MNVDKKPPREAKRFLGAVGLYQPVSVLVTVRMQAMMPIMIPPM